MDFELTILGAGAALPATGRHPTAQLLNMGGRYFLIDCGEGTQARLRSAGQNLQRIERIFISHLHGDHYLGLMGLISSMHLLGRRKELHVHGPAMLEEIIHLQLRASNTYLRFDLHFHDLEHTSGTVIYEDDNRRVTTLALKHRVPCIGFRFDEQNLLRKLNTEKLDMIPHYRRKDIQRGMDLELEDGTLIKNDDLTLGEPFCMSYAYCSDTAYHEDLLPFIRDVDLLYHEATFTNELVERARETQHSTAGQAGSIARSANAGTLMLGHFSSRYRNLDVLLEQARDVFPDSILAEERKTYALTQQGIVKK